MAASSSAREWNVPLWWQLPVPCANNMDTPICDFVREYYGRNTVRLHMPGHKGSNFLGIEHLDITEVNGADSLYEAEGIIARSEKNAAALFGTGGTFYSTEGSSQCIRAMLYLALQNWKMQNRQQKNGQRKKKKCLNTNATINAQNI